MMLSFLFTLKRDVSYSYKDPLGTCTSSIFPSLVILSRLIFLHAYSSRWSY